jgi:predicted RNA-binding Zn-ribbon protein involved in translation (DUF1610 family)
MKPKIEKVKGVEYAYCSDCGERIWNDQVKVNKPKYCPDCGAEIEWEENENE